jgi:nucleoside-diphosphate-sugar epimerase
VLPRPQRPAPALAGTRTVSSSAFPRVALIGASGFIGLRSTELLGARPEMTLVPLVRSPASLAVLARQRLGWRITSFVDPVALAAALQDCAFCVHAAIGDAAQIVRMAEVTYRACATAKVRRLIWLSSASVHGQDCAPGTDESAPLHDHHPLVYNNAKVRAEWSLQKLARDGRVEVVFLRPGVVFGPRSRWITDAANDIRRGRAGWIGGGRGICNSIYVDNLVSAIRQTVVTQAALTGPYLVGDAETVTWRDFLLPIAKHLGRDETAFAEMPIPPLVPEREDRLASLTQTTVYQHLGGFIPDRLKRVVKGVAGAWPDRVPPADGWTLRTSRPTPRVTPELALLQQCTWKLPSTRAERRMGYEPHVTFAEGMRRSLAWLDFSEGRDGPPIASRTNGSDRHEN